MENLKKAEESHYLLDKFLLPNKQAKIRFGSSYQVKIPIQDIDEKFPENKINQINIEEFENKPAKKMRVDK